jgi:ribosomal protein S21
MAVIVHNDMPIEQALKMLWREANREDIPATLLKNRYRNTTTFEKHEQTKVWGKMKRRRRAAKRRLIGKNKTFLQQYYR